MSEDEKRVPMVMGYSDEDGSKQAREKLGEASDDLERRMKIAEFRVRARQVIRGFDYVSSLPMPEPVSSWLKLARLVVDEAAMLLGIDLT